MSVNVIERVCFIWLINIQIDGVTIYGIDITREQCAMQRQKMYISDYAVWYTNEWIAIDDTRITNVLYIKCAFSFN